MVAEAAVAILFTGMAAYALKIQDDYAVAWARQRALWTDVIRLSPDAGDGDVILIDRREIEEPEEIKVAGWAAREYLRRMYEMPAAWERPPEAAYLSYHWRFRIGPRGLQSLYPGYNEFIILEVANGKLHRHSEPFVVGDRLVEPKRVTEPELTRLPTRLLHSLLLLGPDEEAVSYIE
jgi:hypothetical protein